MYEMRQMADVVLPTLSVFFTVNTLVIDRV